MNYITNLDLLAVGIVVAAIGILGFIVYFHCRKSVTNRAFLFFSILTIFYSVVNYLNYQLEYAPGILWLLRFTLLFAVWHAFYFFQLFYVFPEEKKDFPRWYKFILVPLTTLTSILTLTPLVFVELDQIALVGQVTRGVPGPGMALFGILTTFLVVGGIYLLIKKVTKSSGVKRIQLKYILTGAIITFSLILTFNLILPIVFDNLRFVPFAPLFLFPLIIFTAYAIIRHHLLDVKVIATEAITFFVIIFAFVEVIFALNIFERLFRSFIFIILLLFGILLIKSVRREVEQREQLEILTGKLKVANEKLKELDQAKTEFLSITSHQLRTPLAGIKGYVSMMIDGDFGKYSDEQSAVLTRVRAEVDRLIRLVQVFLNVSRIESGKLKIDKIEFNLAELIDTAIKELTPAAEKKKIKLIYKDGDVVTVSADKDKLKDVVVNLIDNAIKYTLKGSITAEVSMKGRNVTVAVHDTGVGIDPAEAGKLFQKFSRMKGIAQVSASGSGLGLFIVKKIVEAHGGKVWAESKGKGKGSTFAFTIPVK